MKKICVVSDIHAGSSYGLLPPNAHYGENDCPQNDCQKYLWDLWLRHCETIKKLRPNLCVFLGDAIDGDQWRNGGREVRSAILSAQIEWASEILSCLPKIPKYFIHGTPYHDGKSGECLELVAKDIQAVQPPRGYPLAGNYSFHGLDLTIEGVDINFLHEIPISGALYRGVAPDREMVWSALAGKEGKAIKCDLIVRAHAHYFAHIEHASKHGVINPCWQLPTPYTTRKSAFRMIPDLGGTLITINGKEKEIGRDPVFVQKFIYPLPKYKAVAV
jgi:hypothetical protein